MDIQSSYSGIRRRFSKAQKEQILQEHREQGVPISQLARKNGIHAVTVYQWKRNMTQDDESITPEKIRELLSEISKLKLENKQLKFKVADLSVTNDIMAEAIEISKKRELLKQVKLLEKSKKQTNSK
ncbi:transposase [bacterium]|jgi:transposase-like protein|nr:transposase [bacterium]